MAMGSGWIWKGPYRWAVGAVPIVTSQGEQWVWDWTTRRPRGFTQRVRERGVWVQYGHEESTDPYKDTTPKN